MEQHSDTEQTLKSIDSADRLLSTIAFVFLSIVFVSSFIAFYSAVEQGNIAYAIFQAFVMSMLSILVITGVKSKKRHQQALEEFAEKHNGDIR